MNIKRFIAAILVASLVIVPGIIPAEAGETDLIIKGAPQVNDVIEPGLSVFEGIYADYTVETISVAESATQVALSDLKAGNIDIGMISRAISVSDDPEGILADLSIAREAIVMIVNSQSELNQINYAQIKAIYEGTVSDWSELGGVPLVPRSLVTTSGLHKTFTSKNWFADVDAALEEPVIDATGLDRPYDSAEMAQAISENPDQIGYIGFGYMPFLDESVKCLSLNPGSGSDYFSPDLKNVYQTKKYPNRQFYLIYRKDNTKQALADYLEFIVSPIGQDEISLAGGVKIFPDTDLNRDRKIDDNDIKALGLKWGDSGDPAWIFEDVNRDGNINVLDAVMVGMWWGYTY